MNKTRSCGHLFLSPLLVLAVLPMSVRTAEPADTPVQDQNPSPVITAEQIEADWLRQAVVRSKPSAGPQISSRSKTRRAAVTV